MLSLFQLKLHDVQAISEVNRTWLRHQSTPIHHRVEFSRHTVPHAYVRTFSAPLVGQTTTLLNFRHPGCQWILIPGLRSAYFWPQWSSDLHRNKTQRPHLKLHQIYPQDYWPHFSNSGTGFWHNNQLSRFNFLLKLKGIKWNSRWQSQVDHSTTPVRQHKFFFYTQ